MSRAEAMGSSWKKEMHGGPLTLEKYHRFFADPWGARITIDHLNHVSADPPDQISPIIPHLIACAP